MNRAQPDRAEKIHAVAARAETEIGRILSAEDEILPSSGFLAAVMERVQQEAVAPPPIPFPWKRIVPGMVLAGGVFGWGVLELMRTTSKLSLPALVTAAQIPAHLPAARAAPIESAGWVALSLGISLASWLLARRLAGTGGLL